MRSGELRQGEEQSVDSGGVDSSRTALFHRGATELWTSGGKVDIVDERAGPL